MKALMYLGEKKLAIQEVPEAQGSFVVDVLGAAICGTDLKTYLKGHPMFKPPAVLGHESIGRVLKAEPATGFAPGDYVVTAPYGNCGKCVMCGKDLGELCTNKHFVPTGMFVERFAVPKGLVKEGVIKLEAYDKAFVLTEPLACVVRGAEKIDLKPGCSLLVAGGGPMGALFARLGQQSGAEVMVSEPNALRRKMLESMGIPSQTPDDVKFGQYDRAAIAVNLPEVVTQVIAGVAPGAKINVFAGLPSGSSFLTDAAAVHYRAVTVTGSSGFALRHFHEAYRMIKENPAAYRQLITREFPMEQAAEAFDLLSRGETFKVMLKP